MEEVKKFTSSELAQFNGKNGNPAYVGYKGKVYDVTESYQWGDGEHLGHMAGSDLTDQMEVAPHGEDVLLERMKVVGELT